VFSIPKSLSCTFEPRRQCPFETFACSFTCLALFSFLSREVTGLYIYIYIYTHTGFGHRSCDYLPSPLIGTIYVRRGSCISHLTASYRLFACRNFHRFVRIGVSLSRQDHLLQGFCRYTTYVLIHVNFVRRNIVRKFNNNRRKSRIPKQGLSMWYSS